MMGSSCRGFFPVWIVGVPSLCSRSIGPCSVRLLLIFTMEFLLVFPGAILSGSSRGAIHRRRGPSHAPQPAPLSADAIDQLSRVFRIDKIPEVLSRHRTPPEYMTDLYGTLAYQNGITKQDTPFNSDVVRGLPDRARGDTLHYFFNTSHIHTTEEIQEAELRIYRMRTSLAGRHPVRGRSSHHLQMDLYEVLEPSSAVTSGSYRLIARRPVSSYGHGWEVFNVTEVVHQWSSNGSDVHGFLITSSSADDQVASNSSSSSRTIRIAQRHEHHDSKQPVLVVYTKENDTIINMQSQTDAAPSQHPAYREYVQFMNEGYRAQHGPYRGPLNTDRTSTSQDSSRTTNATQTTVRSQVSNSRGRRSVDYYRYSKRRKRTCARHDLYVDFAEIGWSGWIISPKGYDAYHCKGECPFPLGQNQKPTNHATVQSIVHALNIGNHVATPCCVPNKLYSISLLYFDDDENVILKQYDDMVAVGCGCH